MSLPGLLDVGLIVAREFDILGVPYLVGGSIASGLHGEPRLTQDVDIAAVMREPHVGPLVKALQGPFYVDDELMRSAIRRRAIFNVIHIRSSNKVDVHVLEPNAFQRNQLERAGRMKLRLEDVQLVPVTSPEDIVLQKLLWFRKSEGALERQLRDVAGVLKLQRERLDLAYMRSWARELDLAELLEEQLRLAGLT
jgi:hypothetical protein